MANQQSDPQSTNKNNEKFLFKIIVQFSIYCHGLDKRLDPYLNRIRELLKSGSAYHDEKMQLEMKGLSSNLATLGVAASNNGVDSYSLVFDCLKQVVNDSEKLKSLALIQERAEQGEFQTGKILLDAIKIIFPAAEIISQESHDKTFSKEQFSQLLDVFVNEIDIPPNFTFSVNLLKQRAKKARDENAFQLVISESIKLLKKIRNHAEVEQEGIETFLETMTGELNKVGSQASSVTESNQIAIVSRQKFSETIHQHVENIKHSTASSEDITVAKENINSHLSEITSSVSGHVDTENLHQEDTERKLKEMSLKIQDMEAETKTLRTNLKLAHDKAMHDPLTGVANRLAYDERVVQEHARWKRYGTPLALLVWDIDLFKQINDNFGHKSGDKTLCLIAELLRQNCRIPDFVARFGGEEFVMLLPNTTASQGLIFAEKTREIIAKSGFNSNGQLIKITISCGISEFMGEDTHEAVFERADKALYQAKSEGRNRCIVG